MINDPTTIAIGGVQDMEKAISNLRAVKENIIDVYHKKTGLSKNKIAKLMEDKTWLNAKKAVQMGFADEVLFESMTRARQEPKAENMADEERVGTEECEALSEEIEKAGKDGG